MCLLSYIQWKCNWICLKDEYKIKVINAIKKKKNTNIQAHWFVRRGLHLHLKFIFKLLFSNFFNFLFWLCHMACRILVHLPGIKPVCPSVATWNLNHWTTREVIKFLLWNIFLKKGYWTPVVSHLTAFRPTFLPLAIAKAYFRHLGWTTYLCFWNWWLFTAENWALTVHRQPAWKHVLPLSLLTHHAIPWPHFPK